MTFSKTVIYTQIQEASIANHQLEQSAKLILQGSIGTKSIGQRSTHQEELGFVLFSLPVCIYCVTAP